MPETWYVWTVAALLALISAGFLLRFVWPALRLRGEAARTRAALRQLAAAAPHAATPAGDLREAIGTQVMAGTAFAHLWAEYAQTLHPQHLEGAGQGRWRATALAETFFTDQALVDTPLKTEYYKHLPGIMTGLGIIGTFTGLIVGLANFDVSIDPGQAQGQLRTLINTVGHAFIVSAVAITLAMLFTWVEKSLVTACYRLAEQLRQEIDSLFDTGADVEYLERLVVAAEASATDVRELRDGLAQQFAQALAEQTQRQIDAADRNSERLAAEIGQLLARGLAQPIADIATAVNVIGARQDETVGRMLTEVLSGFSAQMENMFAGQMRDLHEVLTGTNVAMRRMVEQFSAMAGEIKAAGQDSVAAMSTRVETLASQSESRQQALLLQAGQHADQLRAQLLQSQTESGAHQQQLFVRLGNEVASAIATLDAQSRATADSQQTQADRLLQVTTDTVGDMSGQVERLMALSLATNQQLQASVEVLSRTTADAVQGMNASATTLGTAAGRFAEAGAQVTATVDATARAATDIRTASDAMQMAAGVAHRMLADYSDAHVAFVRLTEELKATIDRARREAGLSAELTDRLEAAAGRLGQAQQQADHYLEGVSKVLGQAHQAFADSVERTLREANRQFQNELSQAVGLLSGAIADLGDTVDTLSAQGRA